MVARIMLLLVTTTMAKHHHSKDPHHNFFGKVYTSIHSVVDSLFESINLVSNFTNETKTKLLLTMHYDLSNIADQTLVMFTDIQKIVKDNGGNRSNPTYLFSKTEEALNKLEDMVNRILNKENYNVYSAIKGIINKHAKEKTRDDDTTKDEEKIKERKKSEKVNINPPFKDSKELTEFVTNFWGKVNKLTTQDTKKSKYGRVTVPPHKNLKVWDAPSSFDFNYADLNYTRRIFRGSKAQVNTFPFIVSIHIMGEFTCSGSIISRDLIITAASCLHVAYKNNSFEQNLKTIYVRLGSDYTTRDGETIPVRNLYFHPEYEPKHLVNNLAIIRLEKRIRFSKQQRRIRRIIWDKTPGDLPNDTKTILILGWGATKPNQVVHKHPKLRVGMLDIYNIDDCKRKYTEDSIKKENFCAALDGVNGSACNGDVGAPGIVGAVLIGVVSFGAPECGAAGAPTVFTKLGSYRPWIESIMNAHNKSNEMNIKNLNTRRKSKHSILLQVSTPGIETEHSNDSDEDADIASLRDTLTELVNTDQAVVDDVIYGDLYDEFNKYFKINDTTEFNEHLISKDNKKDHLSTSIPQPNGMFVIQWKLETTELGNISTHPPLHTTPFETLILRKPRIDSEYNSDNDVTQDDYTDNYESSEEEHGLSIEVPSAKKGSEDKIDISMWSTGSKSESDTRNSDDSSDHSEEIKEFFARNREKTNKRHKAQTISFTGTPDDVEDSAVMLGQGIGKDITRKVVMKHEQLSKHAKSVFDEAKSLATKTYVIDFDTTDVHVSYDIHQHKKSPVKGQGNSSNKSKNKLVPSRLDTDTFILKF